VKSLLLNSRLAAVGVVLAVLALTATALASTSAGGQVKTRKTSLGTILVDSKGKTLYMFAKDKSGKSSCSGACASNWPPYTTTGKPTAGAGAKASMLGTTKRSDGKLQVTYNHHPLYHFKFDTAAGAVKGEGANAFGGHWYAVSANGAKVLPASTGSTGATGATGYGGYGGKSGGYTP
jgi:predicted lipoprotein with Yx(FWY)xxD motif